MSVPPTPAPRPSRVREAAAPEVPAVVHPTWSDTFPWLVQGTTVARPVDWRSPTDSGFDLRLFGSSAGEARVRRRWCALRSRLGADTLVHARQVHGAEVRWHRRDGDRGLRIVPDCDGHATSAPGLVLTVGVADCVPVFLVDPAARAVALLHAGWRGTAAGVLERGVRCLGARVGSRPAHLWVHLGPAICGGCYEVGPEVFESLGLARPSGPAPIDLRAVLAARARAAGVEAAKLTASEHCARCGGGRFFSHRGGDTGRQVAFLGIRA